MKFTTTLTGGKLVRRYRRFLVDVQLDSGAIVTAHCPNSGTMVSCSEPGRPVLLSESNDTHRRNAYTWEMIRMDNSWVGVNVGVPRKVVAEALQAKRVPSLESYNELLLDAEYGRGNKVDIVLHGVEQNIFINVHHVAWAENRTARFPETPNIRVRKGMKELAEIAAQGHRAIAWFFIQREDCDQFAPAVDIDPEFGNILTESARAGVEVLAYRAHISPDAIELGVSIPTLIDAAQFSANG